MFQTKTKINIGLIFCGSIAVTRAKSVYDAFSEKYEVKVTATKSAEKLYQNEFGKDLVIDLFSKNENEKVSHIKYFKECEVIIVYAATYNTINKFANGINDDFILASLSAFAKDIIFVPAMNDNMWNSEILQDNISKIKALSQRFHFINPIVGRLREGTVAIGHVEDTEVILNYVSGILKTKDLFGKKVIVASGSMKSKIDDVREITNSSSGNFAVEFVRQLKLRGANIIWIDNSNHRVSNVDKYVANTNEETIDIAKKFIDADTYYFSLTAGTDFDIKNITNGKLNSKEEFTLQLVPSKKILDELREFNSEFKLISFKLSENVDKAYDHMKKYKSDFVVWNNLKTPRSKNVEGSLITNDNEINLSGTKSEVANIVINRVFK